MARWVINVIAAEDERFHIRYSDALSGGSSFYEQRGLSARGVAEKVRELGPDTTFRWSHEGEMEATDSHPAVMQELQSLGITLRMFRCECGASRQDRRLPCPKCGAA